MFSLVFRCGAFVFITSLSAKNESRLRFVPRLVALFGFSPVFIVCANFPCSGERGVGVVECVFSASHSSSAWRKFSISMGVLPAHLFIDDLFFANHFSWCSQVVFVHLKKGDWNGNKC